MKTKFLLLAFASLLLSSCGYIIQDSDNFFDTSHSHNSLSIKFDTNEENIYFSLNENMVLDFTIDGYNGEDINVFHDKPGSFTCSYSFNEDTGKGTFNLASSEQTITEFYMTCGDVESRHLFFYSLDKDQVSISSDKSELTILDSKVIFEVSLPKGYQGNVDKWESSDSSILQYIESYDNYGVFAMRGIGEVNVHTYVGSTVFNTKFTTPYTCRYVKTNDFLIGGPEQVTINQSIELSLGTSPENATYSSHISWENLTKSYLSVSMLSNGKLKVTGTDVGTGKIKLSTSDYEKTINIDVLDSYAQSISLNKYSLSLGVNQNETLIATLSPENITNKHISWSSNNPSVASVDGNGKVTALSIGTATITAETDNHLTSQCVVTVKDKVLTSISVEGGQREFFEGDSFSYEGLVATVFYSDNSNKVVTPIVTAPDMSKVGYADVKVSYTEDGVTVETTYSINIKAASYSKVELDYNYSHFVENNIYNLAAAPSIGSAKLLVIPVWFTDSENYISSTKKNQVKSDIQKAYFGSNEETGWRSVKSFYEEESFNKLSLDGVVTDWYECGHSASTYRSSSTTTANLVSEAVSWYKSTYSDSTMKSFDCDHNGYLDGVMLIYAAPDYQSGGLDEDDYGNLWAYCYWIQDYNQKNTNKPGPNVFFWASYDFMYGDTTISNYLGGDTSHCNLDAHTYIHEMGHVFGLDDYYDYSGKANPAAGFSMQDYNIGAHDPFSRMALGWIDPYVVTDSCEITINSIESSGDLVLLSPSFSNSPFDEYILLELYTPTGLNEFDSTYQYSGSYPKGPNVAGIRIWHVDARLLYVNSVKSGYPVYSASNVTTDPTYSCTYGISLMMSNTSFASGVEGYYTPLGKDYADYNLLQLIRNSSTSKYNSKTTLSSSNLFKTGDTFSMSEFPLQFVNGSKLDSGLDLGYTVTFTSVTSEKAIINIVKL